MENKGNSLYTNEKRSAQGDATAPRKSVIHRLSSLSGLGPLNWRSLITLVLLLYLLLGPVATQTDIISASLTYPLLILIALAAVVVTIHGTLLKRSLRLAIHPPTSVATSGEVVRIVVTLERARVLPLFALDIMIEFDHDEFPPAVVRVSGFTGRQRRTHLDLAFPHRGSWDIRGARCTLRDVTGLTSHTWRVSEQTAVTIAPPLAYDSRLPVLSSTQRPGDLMVDLYNRHGEPFDIKSYHPSDGLKKIVWKAFAKRGELLSRHPEASMTPEGFIVMFVIAGTEGDATCAQAIAYAESLSTLNLDIIASCEGALSRPPATSPDELRELLIDSVWDAALTKKGHLRGDAASLLDYCGQLTPGVKVHKLILFTTGERIAMQDQATELLDLATWLATQGIDPVFCITPPANAVAPRNRSLIQPLINLVVAPDDTSDPRLTSNAYTSFMNACLHRQWEVHV